MRTPDPTADGLSAPELVYRVDDESSGLVAFVVLHDTTRGPALGGIRFRGYESDDGAREDACGLARQMAWKCTLADLGGGGGKAVVRADTLKDRKRACEVLGDFVESLRGSFLTAGDLGATELDLGWIGKRTRYIADREQVGDLGDASAIGIMSAMEVVARRLGIERFSDTTVAVQGLGAIGLSLVRRLLEAKVTPFIADVDPHAVARAHSLGSVVAVLPEQIARLNVDILAPCAIGGAIDEHVAASTPARAIVGGANRILGTPRAGEILLERNVLYAPDFVVNAGAVIRGGLNMLRGYPGTDEEIRRIGARVESILEESARSGVTPEGIAIDRAERRIKIARNDLR